MSDIGFWMMTVAVIATVLFWLRVLCSGRTPDNENHAAARDIEQGQPRTDQHLGEGNRVAANGAPSQHGNRDHVLTTRPESIPGLLVIYRVGCTYTKFGDAAGCALCLEEYKDGVVCKVLSPCMHMYHLACVIECFKNDRHCPLCRGSLRGSPRDASNRLPLSSSCDEDASSYF